MQCLDLIWIMEDLLFIGEFNEVFSVPKRVFESFGIGKRQEMRTVRIQVDLDVSRCI